MAQGISGLRDLSVNWDDVWQKSVLSVVKPTSRPPVRRRLDFQLAKQPYMSHPMQRLMRSLPPPLMQSVMLHMHRWHAPIIKPLVYVCEQSDHPDHPWVSRLLQAVQRESTLSQVLQCIQQCPLSCRDLDRFFWHTLAHSSVVYWLDTRQDIMSSTRIVSFTDEPPTPLESYHQRIDLSAEQQRITRQWCKTHFDVFGRGEAWVYPAQAPGDVRMIFVPCQLHFFFFALKIALVEYIQHIT
jgi:hypothetical protein